MVIREQAPIGTVPSSLWPRTVIREQSLNPGPSLRGGPRQRAAAARLEREAEERKATAARAKADAEAKDTAARAAGWRDAAEQAEFDRLLAEEARQTAELEAANKVAIAEAA